MTRKIDEFKSGIGSQNTLAVVTTGLADSSQCIADLEHLASLIISRIFEPNDCFTVNEYPIEQLVIAGPPSLANVINDNTPDRIDVYQKYMCFRQFLDDTEDTGSGYEIPSVKQHRPKLGQVLVQQGELPLAVGHGLDVTDDYDQAKLTTERLAEISKERYDRAKKKSQSTRLDRITDDFFDRTPNADHVLIVTDPHCDSAQIETHAMKGENEWVKYPDPAAGNVEILEIPTANNSPLSLIQAAEFDPRFNYDYDRDTISEDQRIRINQWLPAEMHISDPTQEQQEQQEQQEPPKPKSSYQTIADPLT